MTTMEALAETLVRTRIPGYRKGTKQPAFEHSIRVSEILKKHRFHRETCLAGLLHDIVEDGDTSFDELRDMGFSERVVTLVRLCSHDEAIRGGDQRWVKMLAGLIDANHREAWAIKVADVKDNLRSSSTLPPIRARFMREVKAPLILSLSKTLLEKTSLWKALAKEIHYTRTV